jgi:SAM-dependent methyltransferase
MTSPFLPPAQFGPRPSATALGDMGLAALTQVPHQNAAVAGSFTTGIMYLRDAIMGGDHRPAVVLTFVDSLQRLRDIPDGWDMGGALTRALATGYVVPYMAMQPALALLKNNPIFAQAFALAQRGDAAGIARLLDQGLSAVLAQPLLLTLMRSTVISGPEIEFILTAARRRFLALATQDASGDMAFAEALPFTEALAAQCFINEYAFYQDEAEVHDVEALAARIDGVPAPFTTAVLASYGPLRAYSWAAQLPASDLVTRQVREPAEEQALAASIDVLKPIADPTSQVVRALYEENPYPRWVAPYRTPVQDTRALYRQRYPNADFRHLDTVAIPEILVAGCGTGINLLMTVGGYKAWRVTAVDLSRASLAHAKRHLNALGIPHIRLLQADILDLAALAQDFDIIESAGVLHHMADPMKGWRILADKLRPGGVMQICLYSKIARGGIDKLRALAKGRYAPTRDGIATFRRDALAALREPTHPLRPMMQDAGIATSHDFFATSTCRDLFFHPQETAYTVPELERMIADLGLIFRGFALPSPAYLNAYRSRFADDPQGLKLANWHRFEQENPPLFIRMYNFIVQKPL